MLTDHLAVVYPNLLFLSFTKGVNSHSANKTESHRAAYHFIFMRKYTLHETNKLFMYMHCECCVEIFSYQALLTKLRVPVGQ